MNRPLTPPRRRHARLVRTAVGLSLGMIGGSAVLGLAAWETTRGEILQRVLDANLNVARVLAEDLAGEWGPGPQPASLEDLRRYWWETDPLFHGTMQVMGTDGVVLFDSRQPSQEGAYVGDHALPPHPGVPPTLDALAESGRDWAGIRRNGTGEFEAVASANVPGRPALVSIHVPYAAVTSEAFAAALPWVGALAVLAVGAGPVSLLLLHRAYRLSIAETARAEAAMARLHDEVARNAVELRARVEERTAELQEVVREMEGFNYTVAHDLRAPLRSMAGLADVVRLEEGEKLTPRSAELLVGISDSAKRLDRLVTDLLSYAGIGREVDTAVAVDLDAAVASAVAATRAAEGGAAATFTVDRPLPPVLATPMLLDQVLTNLLSNAVKFVPADRVPAVRIRAIRLEHQVRVEVRDNGVGVEPEHRERIFRVFERLHGKAIPGTGVGLAIVRRAVERMGGIAGVEADEAGSGSIFWFVLPAGEERNARPAENGVAGGG